MFKIMDGDDYCYAKGYPTTRYAREAVSSILLNLRELDKQLMVVNQETGEVMAKLSLTIKIEN